MEVSLICSENIKKIIEEILKSKNFKISNNAIITFVEKGLENTQSNKVFILFDPNDLNSLLIFLEGLKFEDNNIQNMIVGKSEEKFELFPYEKIQFFEADNNDIFCIIENDKTLYKVKDKLYELEQKLDSKLFVRVSKSNIVNILNISEIIPWFSSKMLLKFKGSSRHVEVTRSYLKQFKKQLGI